MLTSVSAAIIIPNVVESGDLRVRCWQGVVGIPGVHGSVSEVEEHGARRVVSVDKFLSFSGENIGGILAVEVPCWFQAPSHVQAPIRLLLIHTFFIARFGDCFHTMDTNANSQHSGE